MDYKEHLEKIINCLGDSVFVKDREHRYVFINKKCCENKGRPLEEILGKSDRDFFSRKEADVFWKTDEDVLATGAQNVNEESQTSGDGNTRTILTVKNLYEDSDGNRFVIGASRDITLLKEAQEKLKRYNEELEEKVKARTVELRSANDNMAMQLEQLDFLNKKSIFFSQLIDRESLLPAVFFSFVECFPGAEIIFSELTESGFKIVHTTDRIRRNRLAPVCMDALVYLEATRSDQMVLEKDWRRNSILKEIFDDSLSDLPLYLAIPLACEGKLKGAVQVFTRPEFEAVFERQKSFLSTFASQSTVSIVNASLYAEVADKARLKSEIEVARILQSRFIPRNPQIPGYRLKGLCNPANEVGGDYLDYFVNENGDWVLIIADVCGKGIPAALVMTSLRSSVRSEARRCSSSKALLCAVNRFMQPDLEAENSFITCGCLILKSDGTGFNYARAGHPPLIVYGKSAKPRVLSSRGLALGLLPPAQFDPMLEEFQFTLEPGEKLFNYTDGLDEARDPSKETYGFQRLLGFVEGHSRLPADEMVEQILQDAFAFCKGQRQFDDITMFALEKL